MSAEPCEIGILFGDVAGSTRLYETLGDQRAHAAVKDALTIMADVVRRNGGVVIKTIGDEIMSAFFRAEPMLEASCEIQRHIASARLLEGPVGPQRLNVRIGFHFGTAIRDRGDYYGSTVNAAARMVAIAKGGEIITTLDLRSLVDPVGQDRFRPLEHMRLRGMSEDIQIAEILWQSAPELTQLPDFLHSATVTPMMERLRIAYAADIWMFQPRDPPFGIGREAENRLCIVDSRVSRRHATIERRLTSWVLFDHSSNGTYISFSGEREIMLRRQEIILHGSGRISFGHAYIGAEATCLEFSILTG